MCLASDGPPSVARSGQESIAQGLYVFVARRTVRGACPKGAIGLSPGFQPWVPNTPERRALKHSTCCRLLMPGGRQIESTYTAELRSNCSTWQLRTLILRNNGCENHLVSCRPFRANHLFWRYPGLKPWAKSCCPFGAGPSGRMIMALTNASPVLGKRKTAKNDDDEKDSEILMPNLTCPVEQFNHE